MSTEPCRICGAATTTVFNYGDTPLVQCATCGIVYLQRMPSREELENYYRNNYQLEPEADVASAEQRRMFRLPEQVKLIADLQKLKPAPARLLDVGCDKGFFLDEARRHGYAVFGVEPSESGRNYCRRIGIDVVDDISKRQETFDAATMHHVLEHIPYPVELLQEINRHLAPGGVLMIRVPDFATVWRKIFRTRWKWFQPEAHYFHYTSASLRKLLERTGFEVIRIRSQRPNTPLTMRSNRLANSTFRRYLGMEIPLRRRLSRAYEDLVGIELYAVAVKRGGDQM